MCVSERERGGEREKARKIVTDTETETETLLDTYTSM